MNTASQSRILASICQSSTGVLSLKRKREVTKLFLGNLVRNYETVTVITVSLDRLSEKGTTRGLEIDHIRYINILA